MADKPSLNRPLELFNLEKVDRDIFSWNGKNVGYKRIFGGQVMAQTLIAAYKTVNVEHFAHSFHSYFDIFFFARTYIKPFIQILIIVQDYELVELN